MIQGLTNFFYSAPNQLSPVTFVACATAIGAVVLLGRYLNSWNQRPLPQPPMHQPPLSQPPMHQSLIQPIPPYNGDGNGTMITFELTSNRNIVQQLRTAVLDGKVQTIIQLMQAHVFTEFDRIWEGFSPACGWGLREADKNRPGVRNLFVVNALLQGRPRLSTAGRNQVVKTAYDTKNYEIFKRLLLEGPISPLTQHNLKTSIERNQRNDPDLLTYLNANNSADWTPDQELDPA